MNSRRSQCLDASLNKLTSRVTETEKNIKLLDKRVAALELQMDTAFDEIGKNELRIQMLSSWTIRAINDVDQNSRAMAAEHAITSLRNVFHALSGFQRGVNDTLGLALLCSGEIPIDESEVAGFQQLQKEEGQISESTKIET